MVRHDSKVECGEGNIDLTGVGRGACAAPGIAARNAL
jgi:hypothetical protein